MLFIFQVFSPICSVFCLSVGNGVVEDVWVVVVLRFELLENINIMISFHACRLGRARMDRRRKRG